MYLFPIDIHKGLQQKVKMLKGYKGKFFPCTIQKCKRSDLPAIEHNVTKLKTLRGNKKKIAMSLVLNIMYVSAL